MALNTLEEVDNWNESQSYKNAFEFCEEISIQEHPYLQTSGRVNYVFPLHSKTSPVSRKVLPDTFTSDFLSANLAEYESALRNPAVLVFFINSGAA